MLWQVWHQTPNIAQCNPPSQRPGVSLPVCWWATVGTHVTERPWPCLLAIITRFFPLQFYKAHWGTTLIPLLLCTAQFPTTHCSKLFLKNVWFNYVSYKNGKTIYFILRCKQTNSNVKGCWGYFVNREGVHLGTYIPHSCPCFSSMVYLAFYHVFRILTFEFSPSTLCLTVVFFNKSVFDNYLRYIVRPSKHFRMVATLAQLKCA